MSHRGKHPNDDKCFQPAALQPLKDAVADLSFLHERGYNESSALELVGNRYRLNARQRQALLRVACAPTRAQTRRATQWQPADIVGKELVFDGYNVLIICEVALSGGYIFEGCDGCYRDIASIHGTYHKVEETIPALLLIGQFIRSLQIAGVHWIFDSPISNSGRLKTLLRELAQSEGFLWEVSLANNPDKEIVQRAQPAATSDGWIIDNIPAWFNFSRTLIDQQLPQANILRLF